MHAKRQSVTNWFGMVDAWAEQALCNNSILCGVGNPCNGQAQLQMACSSKVQSGLRFALYVSDNYQPPTH